MRTSTATTKLAETPLGLTLLSDQAKQQIASERWHRDSLPENVQEAIRCRLLSIDQVEQVLRLQDLAEQSPLPPAATLTKERLHPSSEDIELWEQGRAKEVVQAWKLLCLGRRLSD